MFYNFITKYTDIFVEKMREAAKASHIFSTKNIEVFQILAFEILTERLLMTPLVLNNRALCGKYIFVGQLGKGKWAGVGEGRGRYSYLGGGCVYNATLPILVVHLIGRCRS